MPSTPDSVWKEHWRERRRSDGVGTPFTPGARQPSPKQVNWSNDARSRLEKRRLDAQKSPKRQPEPQLQPEPEPEQADRGAKAHEEQHPLISMKNRYLESQESHESLESHDFEGPRTSESDSVPARSMSDDVPARLMSDDANQDI